MGYGDIYPRTGIGRIVMFVCAMFGVIIVSVMVVAVNNSLEMTSLESKAYIVIKKLRIRSRMRHQAAQIMTKAAKMYLKVKNNKNIESKKVFELNHITQKFKRDRR